MLQKVRSLLNVRRGIYSPMCFRREKENKSSSFSRLGRSEMIHTYLFTCSGNQKLHSSKTGSVVVVVVLVVVVMGAVRKLKTLTYMRAWRSISSFCSFISFFGFSGTMEPEGDPGRYQSLIATLDSKGAGT